MEGEGELKAPHRVHLESLARQGDIEAQWELDNVPPLPPLAAHLWAAFLDLHRTRGSSGMGPGPITRLDIRLWEGDEGQFLEPWERRVILAVDQAWLASQAPQG